MAGYKLPKDFFENNPIRPYTVPQFFLGSQILGFHGELNSKLKGLIAQFDGELAANDEAQLRLIEETDDPAALVDLMRKNIRLPNMETYIGKVLTIRANACRFC